MKFLHLLLPILTVAKPFYVGKTVDFCMSENLPYEANESQIFREFDNVHSQLGCSERCLEYPECRS